MSKKGGYVIVDLKGQSITAGTPFTLDGVTARLDRAKTKACLLSGFAIGDEEKRDVFVDLQKTEDGYVALFGQYTITIEDDEVTIAEGGVLMDDIVDSYGRKRFIEGDATLSSIEGITITYCKWSLSGTHLMYVVAGNIANGTTIPDNKPICSAELPKWVIDKIVPYSNQWVDNKTLEIHTNAYTIADAGLMALQKLEQEGSLPTLLRIYNNSGSHSVTTGGSFRLQFDLLIDSAE